MSQYFHYTACGLDNVWLANGYKVKATRHGHAVAVDDVDGLHQLIAQTLIDKPVSISGKEFRFLCTQQMAMPWRARRPCTSWSIKSMWSKK